MILVLNLIFNLDFQSKMFFCGQRLWPSCQWRLLIKCQSEITAGHDLPVCDRAPVTSGNLSTYICMLRRATACPVSHYLRALLLPTSLCIWVRAAYICSLQSPKFLSMPIDQLGCDLESTAVAVQTLTGVQRGNLVSYEPCVL